MKPVDVKSTTDIENNEQDFKSKVGDHVKILKYKKKKKKKKKNWEKTKLQIGLKKFL